MALLRLDLSHFRNFVGLQLEPDAQGFNLLYGLNGSGKTSLLEAIYYLSLGRSFRTSLPGRIIKKDSSKFTIYAQIKSTQDEFIPIGIEKCLEGGTIIRIAGKNADSAAELANLTPVQLINSHSYSLLDAGPVFRRKFMDWGVFYRHPEFLKIWKDYGQALKQRNAGLRSQRPKKEIDVWSQPLSQLAESLDQLRREYFENYLPILMETLPALLDLKGLKVSYLSGWESGKNFPQVLEENYARDRQLKFTQSGPHRADLRITINRVSAKDILSRGQQKLFVCAMILAQGALLKSINKRPIYLIDDLPAELDRMSRNNLISLLSKQQSQVFMTAVEHEALSEGLKGHTFKMFHVEQGCVSVKTRQNY